MNHYEEKQEAKRERMAERAEKLRATAKAEFRKGDLREEFSGIPMGQPILVGHHSEGRHRKIIERADNAMRRGIEAEKQAANLESRVAHPSTAISSDDPDAIPKLQAKIDKAVDKQEFTKKANRLLRKNDESGLREMGFTDATLAAFKTPDFAGRTGFASFELTNNSANIRRMKQRIKTLKAQQSAVTVEKELSQGVRVVENAEENRLQIFFPGKPDFDVRAKLKAAGFRWAPSQGAWQRQLNNRARYAAAHALPELRGNELNPGVEQ
tara:strand:+ start:2341 stop:3144 length:804 start_codon:yes stop_codon:yes gene_type:complete